MRQWRRPKATDPPLYASLYFASWSAHLPCCLSVADDQYFKQSNHRNRMRRIGSILRKHHFDQKVNKNKQTSCCLRCSFLLVVCVSQVVDAFAAVHHFTKLIRLAALEKLSRGDLIQGAPIAHVVLSLPQKTHDCGPILFSVLFQCASTLPPPT